MGRLRRSIELFKASWAVLRHDKELLILPVISGIASLATVGLFAAPVLATVDFDAVAADGSSTVEAGPATFLLLAFAYLFLAFIGIFFNSAIVHAANERMSGGDPTVTSAIAGAGSRIKRILPWAIVSATVSFIINQIQERSGALGSILGFLGGLAWAAVTFLVLPILVIEDVGVIDAVKRSAGLLRNAWGEGLAGHVGLGLIGFLAVIPFFILGGLGLASGAAVVFVPALVIAAIGILAVVIVMSALSIVYQTALYRYATSQPVSEFRPDMMQQAFRSRR